MAGMEAKAGKYVYRAGRQDNEQLMAKISA